MRKIGSIRDVGALAGRVFLLCAAAAALAAPAAAQSSKQKPAAAAPAQPPALVRTTTRHEVRRFGYGNTLTLSGAPVGSITVEAWSRNEIDITADIELRAHTEQELAQLAAVNTVVLDEDSTRVRVITTGTHDRQFMKKVKNFPKHLLAMPWKVDYRVKVPAIIDLEIYAGSGAIDIAGVEGSLQLSAGEADATLRLRGGDVSATITGGTFRLLVPAQSWRGRGVSVRLARGRLVASLPAGFNGEIDATVLRAGRVEDAYGSFAPRERAPRDERNLHARAGGGGASFAFEVGDGVIVFEKLADGGAKR